VAPPSPLPPSACGFITLASLSPQNPEPKGLIDQNLESKGVAGRYLVRSVHFAFAEFTAFAWAIIECVFDWHKGGCHREGL